MKKAFMIFIIFIAQGFAQNNYEKNYIEVIPGAEYKANWFNELFFGSHWRDLWTTPINVEILDLEKFDGGLKPIKKGGGFQTKSLRLISPNGVQWKFRSINKDPSKVLPEELRETFAADILKDQISSANPMAPLISSEILNAVNVLQSKPYLVFMPDNERLGEFRDEFKNTLGFIEIHPDEFDDDSSTIEGSDKIKGTYNLLETIEEKRSNRINSEDFLKARLIDFLLNDWDRHSDQWRWARFKKDSLKIWSPIPRDRDQAFAKYSGLFPYLASVFVPQLNHFDDDFSKVKYQSWSGRYLDRRILISLDKSKWDSVTNYTLNKLTDELIEKSVRVLPGKYYEMSGDEIIYKLKSRRNKLSKISNDFYELTNEVAHVYATSDKDYVEVNFIDDSLTKVEIYKLDKKTNDKKEEPIFSKNFEDNITKEIRIFVLEDDDKVIINGIANSSMDLRIIGDKGEDQIINNSNSEIEIYDLKNKTKISSIEKIVFDESYPQISNKPEERFEPSYNQQGSEFQILPAITFSSDDGILFGGLADLWTYGFNKYPYSTYHQIDYYYSTQLQSYSLNYNGIFNNIFRDHSIKIEAGKTEIKYGYFFGFGNETKLDNNLLETDYYQARNEVVKLSSSILFNRKSKSNFELGLSYEYFESQDVNLNLINEYKFGTYGISGIKLLSFDFGYLFNSVGKADFPENGINLKASSSFYPKLLENESSFAKFYFDFSFYKAFNHFNKSILALRTNAEHILGSKYPYFVIPMLGGKNSLRGFERERFSGSSLLFFQSELRNYLFEMNLIIPVNFGITVSAETGRVFIENEKSYKWHPAYGVGFFVTSFDDEVGISVTTIFSDESTQFYLRTKMGF